MEKDKRPDKRKDFTDGPSEVHHQVGLGTYDVCSAQLVSRSSRFTRETTAQFLTMCRS